MGQALFQDKFSFVDLFQNLAAYDIPIDKFHFNKSSSSQESKADLLSTICSF